MKDELCAAISDSEIRVATDIYPSETRDFIICKQTPGGLQQLNPIELLGNRHGGSHFEIHCEHSRRRPGSTERAISVANPVP